MMLAYWFFALFMLFFASIFLYFFWQNVSFKLRTKQYHITLPQQCSPWVAFCLIMGKELNKENRLLCLQTSFTALSDNEIVLGHNCSKQKINVEFTPT